MMRRWLARLAFSCIILAAVLFWEGHQARQQGKPATWYYLGAAVLAGIGLAGINERHRHDFDDHE